MLAVNRDAQLQWQRLFHTTGCSFSPLFHWCLGKKLDKLIVVRTAIGWEVILPMTKGCVTFGLVCLLDMCPGNGLGDALLKPDQWWEAAAEIGLSMNAVTLTVTAQDVQLLL